MVYYGKPSKGCQRCRQRKIKCDQRKPGCLRCEKAKTRCPGFRNLTDILFRDESKRVIQQARLSYGDGDINDQTSPCLQHSIAAVPEDSASASSILVSPSQPLNELAVNFYFNRYTCTDPPLSKSYRYWLVQMYSDRANHALRAAIEAAGMAGLSNLAYSPEIEFRSKRLYSKALVATNQVLGNSSEHVSDVTVQTVITLALFEFLNMQGAGDYSSMAAHIDGATAQFRLRGHEQFNHELGAQLFAILRHQILFVCMQLGASPPKALTQIRQNFEESPTGQHRKNTPPGPMGELCFRFLEIRARIKNGAPSEVVHRAAAEMDSELKVWRTTLPDGWEYSTVSVPADDSTAYFQGKFHIYRNMNVAKIWNNWRSLRILLNRIMLWHENLHTHSTEPSQSGRAALIRELADDICVSAPCFNEYSTATIIWPLLNVAQEPLVSTPKRRWATNQIRRIGLIMGIRQACLLADRISRSLNNDNSTRLGQWE